MALSSPASAVLSASDTLLTDFLCGQEWTSAQEEFCFLPHIIGDFILYNHVQFNWLKDNNNHKEWQGTSSEKTVILCNKV